MVGSGPPGPESPHRRAAMNSFDNSPGTPGGGWKGTWRAITRAWQRLASSPDVQRLTRGRPGIFIAGGGLAVAGVIAVGVALALAMGGSDDTEVVARTPGPAASATDPAVSEGLLQEEEEPTAGLTEEDLAARGSAGGNAPQAGGPAPNGR